MINKSKLLLLLIISFAVIFRLSTQIGNDDPGNVIHSIFAYKIATGNYNPTAKDSYHSTNIGYIYPMALSYKIFGVSKFSSYFSNLIISVLGIIFVYIFGAYFLNEKTGLLAAFLLSIFPLDIFYSTQTFPDMFQAFFMAIAVILFLIGDNKNQALRKTTLFILSGIFIGLAFTAKQSGILVFVFLFFYILYKQIFIKKKIEINFRYLWILLGFLLTGVGLQLLHDYLTTGNPLLRIDQYNHLYNTSMKQFFNYEGIGLISRLFFHFPYLILANLEFGFFYIFILMASAYMVIYKKEKAYPLLIWWVSLFLYLNFGPTSFNEYIPIAAGSPRYLAIITFPAILTLAYFLSDDNKLIKKFILPFTVIFLLIVSFGAVYLSIDNHKLGSSKQIVDFLDGQPKKPIYTDNKSSILIDFLFKYRKSNLINEYIKLNFPQPGITVLVDLNNVHDAYLVVDFAIINSIPKNYNAIFPSMIYNQPKNWKLLKEVHNKKGNAFVYYLP